MCCRAAFCIGRRRHWKAGDAACGAARQACRLRYCCSNHTPQSKDRPGEHPTSMWPPAPEADTGEGAIPRHSPLVYKCHAHSAIASKVPGAKRGYHAMQANEAARQVQAQLMMGRLSEAAAGVSSAACNGASAAAERDPLVILCGDFNDSPASPACQVCCSRIGQSEKDDKVHTSMVQRRCPGYSCLGCASRLMQTSEAVITLSCRTHSFSCFSLCRW